MHNYTFNVDEGFMIILTQVWFPSNALCLEKKKKNL